MSEATLIQRTHEYALKRLGLCRFYDARFEAGQKKYGRGRKNAAFHRDNLMDAIEEVTDAITILGFYIDRIGKKADASCVWDVQRVSEAIAANNTLFEVFEQLDALRAWTEDNYPELLRENVDRLVYLKAQPHERDE